MHPTMRTQRGGLAAALALTLLTEGCGGSGSSPTGGSGQRPAIVSHVKVLSDKVDDVSSLEAWKRSFLRDGMSDEEKALAAWRSVVMFRQQDDPPLEYLQNSTHVHDPIKDFNVYGYSQCCCSSSFVEALSRAAGLQTRGRILQGHGVAEVAWDGGWHMLDGAFINYFRAGGQSGPIVSADDIFGAVAAFYAQNPEALGNTDLLSAMRLDGRWRSGPPLLAACPFYDDHGLFAAGVHGWHSTMRDYDGTANALVEYDFQLGYEVNVQLRPGERLTRNFGNRGLHVNQADGLECHTAQVQTGQYDLKYTPAWGDLAPGRVGNGVAEYEAPLRDPAFLDGALAAENLAQGGSPALAVHDAASPATLIVRMPSSYVYLAGSLTLGTRIGQGGRIEVSLSDDNGNSWKALGRLTESGEHTIDLSSSIHRRYDYRLRLVLTGGGTGLDRFYVRADIQHSQRALPALAQGDNTITFSVGAQEGTITLSGNTTPSAGAKNLVYTAYRPTVEGLGDPLLYVVDKVGSITFPVETPGPITRLRFGSYFRARDPGDGWDYLVSFDDGATFQLVDHQSGPTPGRARYVTFDRVPPGTRRALVKYEGTQVYGAQLFDFRIDADYLEPRGGFWPVRITYRWEENGQPREDVHVARSAQERYEIHCDAAPSMKAIVVELADGT